MIESRESKRVLLVSIIPQKLSDEDLLKDLEELKALVEAYGGVVEELVVQRREETDRGMYIGRGKIQEVNELVEKKKINIVVLNANVRPTHFLI